MMELIKSSYFYQKLFLHINDKIKLNLIKYNKRLQNITDISLLNYKFFSGKYIIYEGKRKGKIFNAFNDNLIYEGEILNGKKNGRGNEYDENGNTIYDGEYLNGKKI